MMNLTDGNEAELNGLILQRGSMVDEAPRVAMDLLPVELKICNPTLRVNQYPCMDLI